MPSIITWVAKCQFCGAKGNVCGMPAGKRPSYTPTIPGKCPNAPKHNPRWETRDT